MEALSVIFVSCETQTTWGIFAWINISPASSESHAETNTNFKTIYGCMDILKLFMDVWMNILKLFMDVWMDI